MLSSFADRLTAKIKDVGFGLNDLDREISALVDRGCSESLLSPDWSCNMALVDLVNKRPAEASDKVLRVINKTIAKPNAKLQLLALTMLDMCVRNCHPTFYTVLASSLLWGDLLKLAQDTSVTRIDSEVRDKILGMVEDYGRWLPSPPTFRLAYESFVDQGVDFPVRSEADMAPIEPYQPPAPVLRPLLAPTSEAEALQAAMAASLQTAPHSAAPGQTLEASPAAVPAIPADAFEGMSDEDRAAIQAAMAELSMDDMAAQEAAAVAAAADAAEREADAALAAATLAAPQPPTASHAMRTPRTGGDAAPAPTPAPGLAQDAPSGPQTVLAGLRGSMAALRTRVATAVSSGTAPSSASGSMFTPLMHTSAQAGAPGAQAARPAARGTVVGQPVDVQVGQPVGYPSRSQVVELPEHPEEALQVLSTTITLFDEMVRGVPDSSASGVRDPIVTDLAEQCSHYRSKLMELASSLTDEAMLVTALGLNDVLSAALARYDELLAHALSVPSTPTLMSASDAELAARAAAATTAIRNASAGGAAGGYSNDAAAGANFTLLDEDDEEDQGMSLATKRITPSAVGLPASHTCVDPAAPADLLGLGAGLASPTKADADLLGLGNGDSLAGEHIIPSPSAGIQQNAGHVEPAPAVLHNKEPGTGPLAGNTAHGTGAAAHGHDSLI